jgi:NADH-ubiquinone oxidoreductase chain 2
MISISILILLVAKALPFISSKISNIYFTRISTIVFIYAGVLSFNTFYIQSIGSGIGIYSGLFHITNISVFIEFFLLLIGSIILIAWPLYNKSLNNYSSGKKG